jgi:class 3 adenylate cyclase
MTVRSDLISTNRPTSTMTFIFTDIEGSTKLAREHPPTWEVLRARQHAILQVAIGEILSAEAFAKGWGMSIQQAIEFAQEKTGV